MNFCPSLETSQGGAQPGAKGEQLLHSAHVSAGGWATDTSAADRPIHHQPKRFDLGRSPFVAENYRDLIDPQLARGLDAQMTIDDFAIGACQDRNLKPYSRMLLHMRSTTASFFLGFLAYKTKRSIGQVWTSSGGDSTILISEYHLPLSVVNSRSAKTSNQ
jgi:hypothetical protein